jgi:hypothetical protein
LPEAVQVVEADNAIVKYTRLRWLDANHLEVALCAATSFSVVAENMRDPAYIDAGRGDEVGLPNTVWVAVVNLSYSKAKRACVPYSAIS